MIKSRLFHVILVFTVSFGFIAYHFRKVDITTVWAGLKSANFFWLIGGMIAMFLYWLLEALVLHRVSREVNSRQSVWRSFKITMVGQFFNTITPFASGGQPAQVYMLTKTGMDFGSGSSVLLIKFIVYQAMLVVNSVIVLLFGFKYLLNEAIPNLSVLIMFGFALNAIVVVALITVGKSKRVAAMIVHTLLKPVSFFLKKEKSAALKVTIDQKLHSFHMESNRLSFDLKLLLQCSALTAVQLWLFFSIPYFVLQGVGVSPLNAFQIIAFHAFIMMFSSLIPIPGGSGGAELSFSLLFGLILDPATLVLSLFLWRFITYYSCILFGSFSLIGGQTPNTVKRESEKWGQTPTEVKR